MFYGQYKTDRSIAEYFPSDYKGVCIDVGAARPRRNSNSYYFECLGWDTYCIDPRLLEKHQQYQPTLKTILVEQRTLNVFIQEQKITNIDFVSIDTEGTEIEVLQGFNLKSYHPKLLVIENNFGDEAVEKYLKNFGYSKRKRVVINDFYTL